MTSAGLARISRSACILLMVVAVPGFIVMLVLNAFFLDDYDAYGEVPIPGSGSVHLPRGEVTVNFHTVTLGSGGGGLPVPPLGIKMCIRDRYQGNRRGEQSQRGALPGKESPLVGEGEAVVELADVGTGLASLTGHGIPRRSYRGQAFRRPRF